MSDATFELERTRQDGTVDVSGAQCSEFSFSAFEMQYLVMAAERRHCGKQPNGVPSSKFDKGQSQFSIDLHGVMGEYAVAKLLGVKIDHSVSLSGDDKVSDIVYESTTIQVKTNMGRWRNVFLYFNEASLFRADVAVLAVVRSATQVDLLGWIGRDDFNAICEERNFGHGVRACVDDKQLEPMSTLRDRVRASHCENVV